ncbi:hypothetical protein N7493_001207 [Penicillium malachiteum]|uniref:Uncharacterized protein n=1 Tax=Penicillium malachiteum TaxID=1324776 RepID=A0AAD6HTS3_9EURO|nr:hypothetical protein N7493_001207 [Penicillium malachiteum]
MFYRFLSLKSKTIKEMILFLYTLRIDLKDSEIKQLKEYFTLDDIKALKEQSYKKVDKTEINLISDSEKEEEKATEIATSNKLINLGAKSEETGDI